VPAQLSPSDSTTTGGTKSDFIVAALVWHLTQDDSAALATRAARKNADASNAVFLKGYLLSFRVNDKITVYWAACKDEKARRRNANASVFLTGIPIASTLAIIRRKSERMCEDSLGP
jgi:hypothetical protein